MSFLVSARRLALMTAGCATVFTIAVAETAVAGDTFASRGVKPGKTFTVVATGLPAGAPVSLFATPAGTRNRGRVIGPARVVSGSGRLRLRLRWPTSYFACSAASACVTRRWTNGQRVALTLTAPRLRGRLPHPSGFRSRPVRVRVSTPFRGSARRGARKPPLSVRASGAPTATACDSPWMSSAGSVGEGAGFEVSFVPTKRARYLARGIGAYDSIWGDLQRCAQFRGLSKSQHDSMYNQMVCHVLYGVGNLGGPTWDFEAWRPLISGWSALNVADHSCNWDLGPGGGDSHAGSIVQWSGDTKAQKTAWLVVRKPDGRLVRNWIPSSEIYFCLKDQGKPGPSALAASFLDRYLPDETGVHASCARAPQRLDPKPDSGQVPRRLVIVDNRVTNGMQMREDPTPARLTTNPWVYCGRRGCNIAGTELVTGGTYDAAVCQAQGERTTNGNDHDSVDDANPERFESTRYYGVRLASGTFGYISEVWIRSADRGGLGLAGC